jgi:hypothetical protein
MMAKIIAMIRFSSIFQNAMTDIVAAMARHNRLEPGVMGNAGMIARR